MTGSQMLDRYDIQFPELGWHFHIDPTAFSIFGLDIQWYGIIITLGLILAILYVFPRMKRFGIDADRAVDAIIGGVVGGIVGARLYYVIMKWDEYQKGSFGETFKAVINTRKGGLAIYGGIIGSLLVGFIICKIRKVKILPMLDITAIGFLIGQGIGRWGNFVNQEAFGTNTDSFLGMTGGTIQRTINDSMQIGGEMYSSGAEMLWDKPVHPCFLYESVWCLLGFAFLAFMSKRRKYDGQIALMYMAWYGAERFLVEGLRTDSLMVGNIRISQALSAVIFITSVIIQIITFFRLKRDPEHFVLYVNTEEAQLLLEESRRKRMGITGSDAHLGEDDEIGDLSEDDEIGILPIEDDDDDEIGQLPDEDEEDIEALDDAEPAEEDISAEDDADTKEEASENADSEAADSEPAEENTSADNDTDAEEEASEDTDSEADGTETTEENISADDDAEEETDEQEIAEPDDENSDSFIPEDGTDKYEELAEELDSRLNGGSDKGSHNKNKKHMKN